MAWGTFSWPKMLLRSVMIATPAILTTVRTTAADAVYCASV